MAIVGQDIVNIVRNELVESVAGFWQDSEFLTNINRCERDFVNKTRILDRFAFLSTDIGRIDYPLPLDYVGARLVLFNEPSGTTANWFRVLPWNLEKAGQERPDFLITSATQQGTPRRYFIWGRTMYLFPPPDTSTPSNLYLFYKAKPISLNTLNDPINLDDTLSEAIVEYLLWKAWAKADEDKKALEHKETYDNYVREGRKFVKKQSSDQKWRVDLESPVPFGNAGLGGVGGLSGGFDPFSGF